MTSLQSPTVRDKVVWSQQICEHRRYLLERVVACFPELETTKAEQLEELRELVSGPRLSAWGRRTNSHPPPAEELE